MSGGDNVQSTHEFYLKSKLRLATAGFKLRKFTTNSVELRSLIEKDEDPPAEQKDKLHTEEDQTYTKTSLGVKGDDRPGITKAMTGETTPRGSNTFAVTLTRFLLVGSGTSIMCMRSAVSNCS